MAACPQIWRKMPEPQFRWDSSELMMLALGNCRHCGGTGRRFHIEGSTTRVCPCVFRSVFRRCLDMWQTVERLPGCTFGRKGEEFAADFELVSRRTLANDPQDWDIFKLHFLCGFNWHQCCGALHIDRGTFFHKVYSIEERLGRVFRELRPYALHPLEMYFAGGRLSVEELTRSQRNGTLAGKEKVVAGRLQ